MPPASPHVLRRDRAGLATWPPGSALAPRVLHADELLLVLAGGALLRSTLPPPPLAVDLAELSGSTLDGDSFVRLNLSLEATGARDLGDARLTIAGATQRGQHPARFDGDGRMTLQVDVTLTCAQVAAGVQTGVLDLSLHDQEGRAREVRLEVPAEGSLQRLLRYPCR